MQQVLVVAAKSETEVVAAESLGSELLAAARTSARSRVAVLASSQLWHASLDSELASWHHAPGCQLL